tara:strand:- start:331 stop:501 length:171 start_codon:yes stop_codon:yes gene_type:complete
MVNLDLVRTIISQRRAQIILDLHGKSPHKMRLDLHHQYLQDLLIEGARAIPTARDP